MSSSERQRLEKIDTKMGRLIMQFADITNEMGRLYEAEMQANEVQRKILRWIRDTRKRLKRDGKPVETTRLSVLIDDIEALCEERLTKSKSNL